MDNEYDYELESKYKDEIDSLLAPRTPEAIEKYYERLKSKGQAPGLKVKLTSNMGKGVFADKQFRKDELVLQDQMLVGAQHFTNKMDAFVCGFCFRYIGSIEYQIGRRLFLHSQGKHDNSKRHEKGISCYSHSSSNVKKNVPEELVTSLLNGKFQLPYTEKFPLPGVVSCIGGCSDEYYCSVSCAKSAWEEFHCLLCTGEKSISKKKDELLSFKQHADETNDIFHLAAKVIAKVIRNSEGSKTASSKDSAWSKVLESWEPFAMGYKEVWWNCVALPDDIDHTEEMQFRKDLKDLAWTSLQLLKEAIFDEEYAPLFSLRVYGSIIGMFELNNLALVVASPVEDYFIYVDDLPECEKSQVEKITKPLLEALGDDYATHCEGSAFFPFQSCVNHSCDPNCRAFKREQDNDGSAILISLKPIAKDEQIFISYIDEDLPWEERQLLLLDYGIICECPRCLREKANN